MLGPGRQLGLDVPVEIGRDMARQLALDELAKPEYQAAQPSLLQRIVRWLLDRLAQLFNAVGDAPGGVLGLILLAVLVLLAVLLIRYRIGPIRHARASHPAVFDERAVVRTAAEHRSAADAAAAEQDWATAVRERFRAIIRQLEEYDLLDPRAGRTADEAANDAGQALPALAESLRTGATTFDEVMYGEHPASANQDEQLRGLDQAVRSTRRSRSFVGAG
ncbi:MAG: DUF4129 domain-containing protein [Sporichthyaceae bacterium]|nr:DUF4129 domain-containing protein [Sporichthyaceae bacterium]